MTRPTSSSKVLLVADHRSAAAEAEPGDVPVRRYRLARLRFDGRASEPGDRYEHLKRVFD